MRRLSVYSQLCIPEKSEKIVRSVYLKMTYSEQNCCPSGKDAPTFELDGSRTIIDRVFRRATNTAGVKTKWKERCERVYCVIQEIQKKKKNKDGYPKELKSEYMQISIRGAG